MLGRGRRASRWGSVLTWSPTVPTSFVPSRSFRLGPLPPFPFPPGGWLEGGHLRSVTWFGLAADATGMGRASGRGHSFGRTGW